MMKSVTKEKVFHVLKLVLLAVTVTLVLLSLLGTVAHASGLVDDTVNADNLYSKYPLSNYQLDFYVDNSWSWLPWNWLDGIGKSVQYGLYCITNFVWTISLYLSNATGYVVQQAYKLDFINDMADSIGKSIQTLAGVTENGFSSSGFYVGFLLIIILIVGVYTAYTGLLKRETSKALHAVINFVVVFIVSASFIAYAPNYIQKINDFSSDISTASLDLGTKIMLPDSQSKGKDSVDLIRDSLFSIQVEKPWLLLQFGNSDTEEIGADRVEALVSASPSDEDGETRENVVKTEIEDNDNDNLTIPQVVNRLGMVFFLLIFNLGITIFIFLLTGMMLFSQILFIIYAMFLPISFLLSMIPTYENMAKQAVVRVFNAIMTRAGITLIVTVAFSISSMFYNISKDYPFFMVAFLQIICFAGIYMKLGELMSMFSLNANDSQQIGRRIFRRPMVFMRHRARRMERRLARAVGTGSMVGAGAGAVAGSAYNHSRSTHKNTPARPQRNNEVSMGSRVGSAVGAVMDTKIRSYRGRCQGAGRPDFDQDRRYADLQLCERRGRPPDGHYPCHPRQRVSVLDAEVQPAVRCVRLGEARLHPLPARHEGRAEQAVEAQRRCQLSGPRGEGLSARRRAELSAAAGLGTRGRAGDFLSGRDDQDLGSGPHFQVSGYL